MTKKANLRTCACCEWIFTRDQQHPEMGGCPQCGFGHYGARNVYGHKAYQFARTQQPWFDKKMATYAAQLQAQINKAVVTAKGSRTPELA